MSEFLISRRRTARLFRIARKSDAELETTNVHRRLPPIQRTFTCQAVHDLGLDPAFHQQPHGISDQRVCHFRFLLCVALALI
jgi:hypothetical protein